jgi:hypothetical protein
MKTENIKYWETETPEAVHTKNYQFALYRNANVLQISRVIPNSDRIAKAVGLHLDELDASPDAKAFITRVLNEKRG